VTSSFILFTIQDTTPFTYGQKLSGSVVKMGLSGKLKGYPYAEYTTGTASKQRGQ
jgi:hypothetical protein